MWFDNINVSHRVNINYVQDLWFHSDGEQFIMHLIEMGGINSSVCSEAFFFQSLEMQLYINAFYISYSSILEDSGLRIQFLQKLM